MKEAARRGWLVSPAQQTAEKEADAQWAYRSKLQPAPEVGMVPKEEFHKDLESVRALLAQPKIRGHSTTVGRYDGSHSQDAAGTLAAGPAGVSDHGHVPEMVRTQCVVDGWRPNSSGPPKAVAADEGASGACLQLVRTAQAPRPNFGLPQIPPSLRSLKLANPHNLCYLHAVIHLLAYVAAATTAELGPQG